MSRRIEVTVPNDWAIPVRECLTDKSRCDLSEGTGKPSMIVEVPGLLNTIFFVTVPGPSVSPTLEFLRKSGIGVSVGRIILTSIEFLKPGLDRPLQKIIQLHKDDDALLLDSEKEVPKKKGPLTGFQHFQKARRTTEELYNDISNGATMNMNTWLNLIGASLMAAGGLTTNTTVFIVAAMLVSPIMGPILGMTLGYRIADWPLFRNSFISEIKMAITAFLTGLIYGFVLGDVGSTYNWPTSAMSPSESQGFNLVVSIIVSAAAGVVLGVSLTSTGGNALVGTAISAGLLPPIVNAGMLIAYSIAYAPAKTKDIFYEMGNYAILFYFSHVVTIIVIANLVFWLKDIDPRFRDGEDASFDDIPSLVEHKKRLEASGVNAERAKAAYFVNNIKGDVKELALDFKDRASGIVNIVTGGLIGQRERERDRAREERSERGGNVRRRAQSGSSNHSDDYVERGGSGYHSRSNSIDDSSGLNPAHSSSFPYKSPTNQNSVNNNMNSSSYSFNPVGGMGGTDVRASLGVIEEDDDENMVRSPVHMQSSSVVNPLVGGHGVVDESVSHV